MFMSKIARPAGVHYNRCVSESVRDQFLKMFIALEPHGMFDQIMHHSAGNDHFAFHTFLLTPDIGHGSCTFRSVDLK